MGFWRKVARFLKYLAVADIAGRQGLEHQDLARRTGHLLAKTTARFSATLGKDAVQSDLAAGPRQGSAPPREYSDRRAARCRSAPHPGRSDGRVMSAGPRRLLAGNLSPGVCRVLQQNLPQADVQQVVFSSVPFALCYAGVEDTISAAWRQSAPAPVSTSVALPARKRWFQPATSLAYSCRALRSSS
jgi:hypothetical protein